MRARWRWRLGSIADGRRLFVWGCFFGDPIPVTLSNHSNGTCRGCEASWQESRITCSQEVLSGKPVNYGMQGQARTEVPVYIIIKLFFFDLA
jgi:hypothetical protein